MAKVVMTGWGDQFHMIDLIKTINEHTELDMKDSMNLAELFVNKKIATIDVSYIEAAQSLAAKIRKSDVICHVEEYGNIIMPTQNDDGIKQFQEYFKEVKALKGNIPSQHLYHIEHDGYHIHAGRLPNRNQVLIGGIEMVEFDAEGNYLRVSTMSVSQGDEAPENQFENWQECIGFVPETIAVKKFFLPELWIGIQDLPDYYQEVYDNPEDTEDIKGFHETLQQWVADGDFVLWFNEDYYMTKEGYLHSS